MWGWVLGGANNGCLGPAVPAAGTSAKPGQTGGQGVARRGCHGDGADLNREGMLNEAIVWPKWSTPHKEWHIQTFIQAYCCGRPAECRRTTVYPTGSPRSSIWGHEALAPAGTDFKVSPCVCVCVVNITEVVWEKRVTPALTHLLQDMIKGILTWTESKEHITYAHLVDQS